MSTHTSTPKVLPVEVIQTGTRRRWTAEEKLRILAESFSARRMVKPTARRYGLSTGQLYIWRSMARQGKLSSEAQEQSFLPAAIAPDGASSVRWTSSAGSVDTALSDGRMIIALAGGRQIIVDRNVDAVALRRVVEALERP